MKNLMCGSIASRFGILCLGLFLGISGNHSIWAQTWQTVGGGVPVGMVPTSVGAGSGNTLYAGFGGSGTYKSTDNGVTWTKMSSGLESVSGDLNSPTVDARSFLKLGTRIVHGTTVQSWAQHGGPFSILFGQRR